MAASRPLSLSICVVQARGGPTSALCRRRYQKNMAAWPATSCRGSPFAGPAGPGEDDCPTGWAARGGGRCCTRAGPNIPLLAAAAWSRRTGCRLMVVAGIAGDFRRMAVGAAGEDLASRRTAGALFCVSLRPVGFTREGDTHSNSGLAHGNHTGRADVGLSARRRMRHPVAQAEAGTKACVAAGVAQAGAGTKARVAVGAAQAGPGTTGYAAVGAALAGPGTKGYVAAHRTTARCAAVAAGRAGHAVRQEEASYRPALLGWRPGTTLGAPVHCIPPTGCLR